MPENYLVRVQKEDHIFSAAHFITFDDDVCEQIHGHNYRVWVEVEGPLDENHYVVDFIALSEGLKAITSKLDHHVLLPTQHPMIRVTAGEQEVEARFAERRWVFPREDCILLPVANTTAELLARYIAKQLLDDLQQRAGTRPRVVRVGVDENHNQWGVCELQDE